jgi:hypothetical protein
MKEKLLTEKNIDWEAMDPHFKFGTFIKRRLVEMDVPEQFKQFSKSTN